ncbi:MAG: VWA domain-containing protein [Candidatus Omnitrophica bacterium]|nr:VWA domain-containing protein [Candidatus Omnitrophota bacterium]
MKWGAPYLRILLLLVPAASMFFWLAGRMRHKALERFAGSRLVGEIAASRDRRKVRVKRWIFVTALLFAVLALMRPQYGYGWREVKRQGLDILIALDTSKSMLAQDVLPDRLQRSKLAITDLVKELGGDRIGLIVFSGTAFLQCPLTVDYSGFLLSLKDVGVNTIPVGGTSLSNAIYTAISSFEGGKGKHKILIIITDGEDLEGGVEKAVMKAKAEGVMISCVGIGSPEGDLIPVKNRGGDTVFLKDPRGNVVKTRLNEDVLESIAVSTGGMYVRSTGAEFGLDLIYKNKLSGLEKQEFESRMEKLYRERFQIPLGIAFLLFLLEPVIGDRKKDEF